MENRPQSGERIVGFIVFAGIGSGTLALLLAIITILLGEWLAAGTGLLAAGVTFGLLANAYLRS